MRRLLLLCLALTACSEKKLALVHARYEPPNGIDFIGEDPGPPPRAEFSSGLAISRLPSADPAQVLELTHLTTCATTSTRDGTLPVGPVTRTELGCPDGTRALLYVAPRKAGALVVILRAPESSFGVLEAKVEQSLSSLHADP